ncbi:magnesium transporter [Carnimonas nigrificans]|uniref:magnesium transporter n=1 Tax=Carnimonas nigrificans TaxID=64323 RepID=UPI0004715DE2|nr:magnesium transporter [Carnimonas nigrificans]
MNFKDLLPDVREAIEDGDDARLDALFSEARSADIAEVISHEDDDTALRVLERLPLERRGRVFSYLPEGYQRDIAIELDDAQLAQLFTQMEPDDIADVLNFFPPVRREAILRRVASSERAEIRHLASYDEGTAGALMTTDYVAVPQHLTVSEALSRVRQTAPDAETIYQIYFLDDALHLTGTMSLRQLILADPQASLESVMISDVISMGVDTPQEDVAKAISRYDLLALPVVNQDRVLVGIVTYDDAMDVVERETTDDFHKSGSVGSLVRGIGRSSLFHLYRSRVFWLVLLVFGNLFSGAGIAHFEDTISAHVALVFFLPLLIGSGGNAGSQAATLMVRGLGTGEVNIRDWTRLLSREVLVSAFLGITMAIAISPISAFRGGFGVSEVVAISMVVIVVCGSLLGMSLPFLLDRLKVDPATASAPLVSTLCDCCGVLIYFSIASMVLSL